MNPFTGELDQLWDVAIVGSGMGGGVLARQLAARGHSVLLLEKGTQIDRPVDGQGSPDPAVRMDAGWWPHETSTTDGDGRVRRFFAATGCAVGGSTIHYAAALERMDASDFDGLTTESGQIPAWPIRFADFERHYEHAERMFEVDGDRRNQAELRLSEWDRSFLSHLRRKGLRPEPLNVAIRYDESCEECTNRVCERRCKRDARTVGVDVAMRFPRFRLLTQCDVLRLDADADTVRNIVALHQGMELRLQARIVVLSAGALQTPQILLRSSNAFWPRGLANNSDQVGRNLMFHTIDILALWAPRRLNRAARQRKAVSIRDFYRYQGERLGYVQSMGMEAGHGIIAVYLKQLLRRHGIRNETLLKLLVALPARIAARVLGAAVIFAAMTEDDPAPGNRLVLDPDEPGGSLLHYVITDDLRSRADKLRKEFGRHVAPWRMVRVSPQLDMNYGHPCGTCRFGDDPERSVLDRDCKAHDLDNLYVVDASFMPRSGGVNPSLTIAANAIRVAETIDARLNVAFEPARYSAALS